MTLLTVQTVVDAGLTPALAAVTASDTFVDDGSARTYVEVNNANAGSLTVTVPSQLASVNTPGVGVQTVPDITVVIPTATRKLIGPFTTAYRNSAGLVTANYSLTASVTAGAFKLAKED